MGRELLDEIISQTDLPKELLEKELQTRLKTANISLSELNLAQFRKIMVAYLQETFIETKQELVK